MLDLLQNLPARYAAILIPAVLLLTGFPLLYLRAVRMEKELHRLRDIQAMVSSYGQSIIAMDARIGSMEARITEFTDRNLEIQSQIAFNRSFEEAARLVRDGKSAASLVESCGLSDAEAELMVRLNQSIEPRPRKHLKQAPVLPQPDSAQHEAGAGEPVQEEIRIREALRSARAR